VLKKKARLFLWPSSPGPASSALVGADRQRSASALVHASMRDLNKDRKHPCFFRAERICCHTTCAGARHGRQAGRQAQPRPSSFSLSYRLMITYSSRCLLSRKSSTGLALLQLLGFPSLGTHDALAHRRLLACTPVVDRRWVQRVGNFLFAGGER
jgi:hypothetical protein